MPARDIAAPQAGLRQPGVRLRNKSNDIIRAAVVVPAGDELEASDYVAGQLVGQSSAFEIVADAGAAGAGDGPESETAPPAVSDSGVEEAGGGSARRRAGRRGAEQ